MESLTPFQKKVARWFFKRKLLGPAIQVLAIILWISVATILSIELIPTSSLGIGLALFIVITIISFLPFKFIFAALLNISRLPEFAVPQAEKFAEKYPNVKTHLDILCQNAWRTDDGSELQEALEKFKILAGKEKSLADLPIQAEKLKTEIAALEKELGI